MKNLYKKILCILCMLVMAMPFAACENNNEGIDGIRTKYSYAVIYQENVHLVAEVNTARSKGSGFIIDGNNECFFVATALHVLSPTYNIIGDESFSIDTSDLDGLNVTVQGHKFLLDANALLGFSRDFDVAFLKIAKGDINIKTDRFEPDHIETVVGREVLAIGNSLGEGIAGFEGIISDACRIRPLNIVKGRTHTFPTVMTSHNLNFGMSGCPVFDLRGNISGMGFAKTDFYVVDGKEYPVYGHSYLVPYDIVEALFKRCVVSGIAGIETDHTVIRFDYENDILNVKVYLANAGYVIFEKSNGAFKVKESSGAGSSHLSKTKLVISLMGYDVNDHFNVTAQLLKKQYDTDNRILVGYEDSTTTEIF